MLDKQEQFCKWTLLVLLLASLVLPVYLIVRMNLFYATYPLEAILFFCFIASTIQSIPGMIGWFMLHRYNEKGKRVLRSTYITTCAGYAFLSAALLITTFFPNVFYIYPLEQVSVFALFSHSALILILQHFWTRYVF